MHGSHRLPRLNQSVPGPTCSIQLENRAQLDAAEYTSVNGQTTRKHLCVMEMCTTAWLQCAWSMHTVLVVLFVELCAGTIKCMFDYLCKCVSVCNTVWPAPQMTELLNMSASACYLWMFRICCANSMNASTWWLLSGIWTYMIRSLLMLKQSWLCRLLFSPCWVLSANEQTSLPVCVRVCVCMNDRKRKVHVCHPLKPCWH